MNTDIIDREVLIEAPVERVWSLITEAEHLGTWFGEAGADIDLRPGGALEVRWDGHQINGTVEAVEPTSRFAFRWRQMEVPAGVTLAEGNSTLVEFLLATEGGATRVRVVESGFGALAISAKDRIDMFNAHSEGWPRELGDLETHAAGVAA
ncbi:MAG: SRPBCC domain-containing protein [Aeromicrobium sp.]